MTNWLAIFVNVATVVAFYFIGIVIAWLYKKFHKPKDDGDW